MKAVHIVGAPGSGLTLLTSILKAAGMRQDERVQEQYVDINSRILHRYGGSLCNPPVLNKSWYLDEKLRELRSTAVELIYRSSSETLLLSDSQTCITYQFWKWVCSHDHYVLMHRNCAENTRSLSLKYEMELHPAVCLWADYNTQALSIADSHRYCVDFDRFFAGYGWEDDATVMLRRMFQWLGVEQDYPLSDAKLKSLIKKAVIPGMRTIEYSSEEIELTMPRDLLIELYRVQSLLDDSTDRIIF